jgi:hypothetical protein
MTLGGADRGASSAAALSNPGDYCRVYCVLPRGLRRLDVPTYGSNLEDLGTPSGKQCIRTVLATIGLSRRHKVKMMSDQISASLHAAGSQTGL